MNIKRIKAAQAAFQKSQLGKEMNHQDLQYPLIQKLYAINGLEILGGGACPEQYDVFYLQKQVAYLRLRHGIFTVEYLDTPGEVIYEALVYGDGIFDKDERLNCLLKAKKKLIKYLHDCS